MTTGTGGNGNALRRVAVTIGWLLVAATVAFGATTAVADQKDAVEELSKYTREIPSADSEDKVDDTVTWLYNKDFAHGTYIIDQPGYYKLAEDISFNPNSPATLDAALANGTIDAETAARLDLAKPVDAYRAGWPLASQFLYAPGDAFVPGGPTDARYDPAAYGVGFFAAVAIEADGVVLDLGGHTLEQSAEHALLQRFFAVIELADQPFIPAQGPAGFGAELDPAKDIVIKNGTIGRSAHHGIHGNANEDVLVTNVDFVDYEVAAIALNGVDGLRVQNVKATNRTDVPILGTYSSARFISVYLDDLVRSGSTTTLNVKGRTLDAATVRDELRAAINEVHDDVIVSGAGVIDRSAHPDSHALFHNTLGVVDGNSYGFLLNQLGVAVNGFPMQPTADTASRNIRFRNVHIDGQHSAINEIPTLSTGSGPTNDPVGAVWQLLNLDPVTGAPITVTDTRLANAYYRGNVVANAQALVAKAIAAGDFDNSHLDVSRSSLTPEALAWVEGVPGSQTLADIDASFICNGDSMFHVNKGAIGFKIDAADNVKLKHTSVHNVTNLGLPGATICDYDQTSFSHSLATLPGYGGAIVRGYSVAGSTDVKIKHASVSGLSSASGAVVGFDVFTDSANVRVAYTETSGLYAGTQLAATVDPSGPNHPAVAVAWHIGADAYDNRVAKSCADDLVGKDDATDLWDEGTNTRTRKLC